MRKRFLITILIILSINIAALLFGFAAASKLKKTKNEIFQIKDKLSEIEEKSKRAKTSRDFLERFKNERNIIESAFLNKDTVLQFIEELEGIAGLNNLEASLSINNQEDKPIFNVLLKGDFGKIIKYIELVEAMPYQTAVKTLNLSNPKETQKQEWEARLEVYLLSYKN